MIFKEEDALFKEEDALFKVLMFVLFCAAFTVVVGLGALIYLVVNLVIATVETL